MSGTCQARSRQRLRKSAKQADPAPASLICPSWFRLTSLPSRLIRSRLHPQTAPDIKFRSANQMAGPRSPRQARNAAQWSAPAINGHYFMEGTAWISLLLFLSSAILLIVYVNSTFSLRKMCRACSVAQTSDEVNHLRLQAMLASIGDGVVATDKDGNVIFLNQVAQDMLSWTPEMISKPLSDVSVLADENG